MPSRWKLYRFICDIDSNPLKDHFHENIHSRSPSSVLIDPKRLESILNGGNSGLPPSAAYIIRKQLDEADIIVINKADLLDNSEADRLKTQTELEWPDASVFLLSAKNGSGLDDWLRRVTSDDHGRCTYIGNRL